MRVLAIDHGTKRMGIAVSDELGMLAQPVGFIPAEPFEEFLVELKGLLAEREVEQVLVGMPRNMDGSYGPQALKVPDFVAVLKRAVSQPVKTWDERLTTVQAAGKLRASGKKARQQKEKVDAAAAAVLLQGYLDSFTA
ncbi:MAG: Holliday junction resolvase RuvX [Verrucomicrobiales bacterium]|nr:Holliday junction resolvase RuvX [Verrucomicrobiales bacterium]